MYAAEAAAIAIHSFIVATIVVAAEAAKDAATATAVSEFSQLSSYSAAAFSAAAFSVAAAIAAVIIVTTAFFATAFTSLAFRLSISALLAFMLASVHFFLETFLDDIEDLD